MKAKDTIVRVHIPKQDVIFIRDFNKKDIIKEIENTYGNLKYEILNDFDEVDK